MKRRKIPCSSRAAFRPTCHRDLDFILTSERHPENKPFIRRWPVRLHEAGMKDPNVAHLIVENVSNHEPVGYVVLVGLQDADFCLELKRMVIAKKGCGYCQEALLLSLAYAFENHTFHRLWLDVFTNHKRLIKLLKSEGFTAEGVHREAARHKTGFVDVKVMSILRSEYFGRLHSRPTRIIGDTFEIREQSGELYIR